MTGSGDRPAVAERGGRGPEIVVPRVEPMRILVLGPVSAIDDDVPVNLGGAMQRRVLSLLVAARGDPISAGTLIGRAWPDGAPPRPGCRRAGD